MSTLSPRIAAENIGFPLDSFFYHSAIGVVLVSIPKVGCSALKRWMIEIVDPHTLDDPGMDVHGYSLRKFALSARSAQEAETLLTSSPVITFVRDPLERLRSAFIDKFVRPTATELFPPAIELLEDWGASHGAGAHLFDRRFSFREFVHYIAEADESHLDRHWRPQAAFLRGHHLDLIAPLEHLSPALTTLAATLGVAPPSAAETNVTRKEPAPIDDLPDVPAGELHRLNLRPVTTQLVDDAILSLAKAALADDYRLYENSLNIAPTATLQALVGAIAAKARETRGPTI